VKCLAYSPLLAHWCGFDIMKRTPSESVFSRFEKDLTEPELQKALFRKVSILTVKYSQEAVGIYCASP